ncbi:hypothetical protein HMPREF0591_5736 [Mycobacterium parascrofulaceum ATCC BAA-614]|uniref:Uncharacterized protein n=1 Tax=Mycobacterium parascrofulaceum ATCC BAA-614 TaxID=525368 RepID=D5PHU2_9MYCO|nr:hypothetical protein HMPREF0591_5736 [Mycobacterium parascrofulaceum ATCC BAA-614]
MNHRPGHVIAAGVHTVDPAPTPPDGQCRDPVHPQAAGRATPRAPGVPPPYPGPAPVRRNRSSSSASNLR